MPTAALRGPLRPDRRLSRFWTLLKDVTGRPLTGRLLTGKPLTGRLLDTSNYRKAYGKLRGGTLPELGGNFRRFMARLRGARPQSHIKASAQNHEAQVACIGLCRAYGGLTRALTARPPVEPFLDPFKGPYRKVPYREASYGKKTPDGEAARHF